MPSDYLGKCNMTKIGISQRKVLIDLLDKTLIMLDLNILSAQWKGGESHYERVT